MKKITVIGSGTMGSGIAHCFAQYGFDIVLVDIRQAALDLALDKIAANFDRQIKKGVLTLEQKEASLARLTTSTTLSSAVAQADLVVEAATENQALKAKIFQDIDTHAPATCLLATNTSSLSITALAAHTKRPAQVIGMHFMNPVPIMRLVEIIRGQNTSDATLAAITQLTTKVEKVPLVARDHGVCCQPYSLAHDQRGHRNLISRRGHVEAIDEMMKLGMGHPMGPLRLADFIGLDVCLSVLEVLHQGFGKDKYAPCPLLRNMVAAGNLGVKTQRGFYDYSTDPKHPTPLQF